MGFVVEGEPALPAYLMFDTSATDEINTPFVMFLNEGLPSLNPSFRQEKADFGTGGKTLVLKRWYTEGCVVEDKVSGINHCSEMKMR